MKQFKGTQGEWKLSEEITHGRQMVDLGEWNGCVDVWHHYGNSITKQEAIANAELIAAAPELLNVLQVFVDFPKEDLEGWIDEGTPVTMTVQSEDLYKALNAINKALGIN
jgi:hypothetical protein